MFRMRPHPTEFQQHALRSAYRHIEAPMPFESVPTQRARCPNCHQPAVAPVVSTYLGDGLVEDDWVCGACGFAWRSGFGGLLV
jgi:hypothetical protein